MSDISKIIDLLRNRYFIVWGLASLYDKYVHCIDLSKVIMYVDRNPQKIGTLHNGVKVISPEMINFDDVDCDSVVVIVSSSFFSEIYESAIKIGFKSEQVIPVSMINIYRFYEMEHFSQEKKDINVLINIPRENLRFYPDLNNFHILNEIMVTKNYYEADVLFSSMKYMDKNNDGIILDVGSNIGNHAFFWHQMTTKNIHCFEGDKLNFNVLINNISLNKFDQRITPYNLCVSDVSGNKYMFDAANGINRGANIARMTSSIIGTDSIRLDDLLFSKKVDLIKIDVEGMEPEVLRGGRGVIERDSPTIIFEAHTIEHMQACLCELPSYVIVESFLDRTPTYIATRV